MLRVLLAPLRRGVAVTVGRRWATARAGSKKAEPAVAADANAPPLGSSSVGGPRLHAAVCLERLPLIHEELPEWERSFLEMQREVYNKTAKVYPKGFLSDAAQRAASEPDARNWQPYPRITEADKKNDRKSLMRKLDRRLFLLVKTPKNVWQFPQVQHKLGETMMETSERALSTSVKPINQDVYFISNAPAGVLRFPLGAEQVQDKVFYFRAQHLYGKFTLHQNMAIDYVWVTREELAEYLEQPVAAYMEKLLSRF